MEAHAADGEDPGQGQNAAAHGGGAQVNDLGASPSIAMLVIKHGITYNHDVDLGHIYIYTYCKPLYKPSIYILCIYHGQSLLDLRLVPTWALKNCLGMEGFTTVKG